MNDLVETQASVMVAQDDIRSRIHTIRGVQVILDSDLAMLYRVETRVFNQAVKRNAERFPENFRFQLTAEEHRLLLSQFVTAKRERGVETRGGQHNRPFVFTEQGIAMLAGVLKSDVAVQASIRIMNTFVAMRRTLATMAPLLSRIEATERRQLKQEDAQARNEARFTEIFDAMNANKFPPQKIFFKGTPENAYSFMVKLIKKAKSEIVLVDGYVDDVTFDILAKKHSGVNVRVSTSTKNKTSPVEIAKFNAQYPTLTLSKTDNFHDRFLILDGTLLYHVGGSLKDLGRRCFAVAELDAMFIPLIMKNI